MDGDKKNLVGFFDRTRGYEISSLGESCFRGCTNLTAASFPGIKVINSHAFTDCVNLKNLNISSVEDFDGSIINSCRNLEQIYVNSKSATTIDNGYG